MDKGHKQVEKRLKSLEKVLRALYVAKGKDIVGQYNDFLQAFIKQDKLLAEAVKAGTMKRADWIAWRRGQILTSQRLQGMITECAREIGNINKIAQEAVNKHLADVYEISHNAGVAEVSKIAGKNLSATFSLVNKGTVVMAINPAKDIIWNERRLRSAFAQSIIQGESIDKMANRILDVSSMDRKQAVRAARTMTTNAENSARLESYLEARTLGIEVKKRWDAFFDERTRESHMEISGTVLPIDEPFELVNSDGSTCYMMYPADPDGDPEQVYNCRCTMVAIQ